MLKKPIFTFLLLIVCSLEATESAVVQRGFVFHKPSFDFCHAPTLTETKTGEILCSFFAGSFEGAKDTAIWLSHLNAKEWSTPKVVANPSSASWNPVLYTFPSGEVFLFYKAGPNPQQWSGFITRSKDHGETWSSAEDLPAGVIGPVKNRPLLLKDHTLLAGSSIESWERWGCWVDITSDQGKTWQKSNPINVKSQFFGIIQPALFFSHNHTIKMLTRSHQIGYICMAESNDGGRNWGYATATTLPNPNSGIDAINLQDGRVLLVYNHSQTERTPLNIAISKDGGNHWETVLTLEDGPGEFSYPCVIQSSDGMVHITYTWKKENIRYVVLDPNKI